MYHPTRGGTRGGQSEFTWDQVRSDQHRENYLGHSVLAPTGRWQNNKDVNWYNKNNDANQDGIDTAAEKRRKELMEVKMREEEEMNKRLGIKPGQGMMGASPAVGDVLLRGSSQFASSSSRAGTGSNRAPLDAPRSKWNPPNNLEGGKKIDEESGVDSSLTKEELRAAKKLAKMQVKEERREERRKRREARGHHSKSREYSSDEESDRERRLRYRSSRHDEDDRFDERKDRYRGNVNVDRKEVSGYRDHRRRDEYEDERRYQEISRDRTNGSLGRHDRGEDRHYDDDRRQRYQRRGSPQEERRGEDHNRSLIHREDRQRNGDLHRRHERSRSPGRSMTPEMQRRRRD